MSTTSFNALSRHKNLEFAEPWLVVSVCVLGTKAAKGESHTTRGKSWSHTKSLFIVLYRIALSAPSSAPIDG